MDFTVDKTCDGRTLRDYLRGGLGVSSGLLSALRRFAAGDSPYKTPFIDIIFIDNFRADCFLSPEIRFTPRNTRNDSRKARRQK